MSTPNVRQQGPLLERAALESAYRHVYRDPENEVGGLLLGTMRNGRPLITASVEATGASGDVTSLTFTHDSWAAMLAVADRDHPDAEILGWYHSHPGHGIFLSEHDQFIHRNFFPAEWQVAVVVDPKRHTEGLFAWAGGRLELIAGTGSRPMPLASGRRHIEIDLGADDWASAPLRTSAPDQPPRPAGRRAPRAKAKPIGLLLPAGAGLFLGAFVGFIA